LSRGHDAAGRGTLRRGGPGAATIATAARNEGANWMSWTPEEIEARARALGTWFHNIDIAGVKTAPDHFLGDYPALKWRRFADAVARDLSGKTVLDIGCNGGFYSIEMKRRGAARVLGIDHDETYL